ncbi:MAG TPA: ABC transporter ATP-binding protein [Virgibacillus sp.]|nr:ABC transporter ATP-binding protein [Virgibacillus sp.]
MVELEVKDVSFSYMKNNPILEDLNVTFNGNPIAIVGQNGAGKTTLVKLLKGLLKPDTGYITLNGEDIANKTVASLSAHIGLVFQNPNDQIFKNTVIDEVMFGPLNTEYHTEAAKASAQSALKKVGLESHTKENPYDLSLSERKRIAIASILAMDTDVIIFDEPTMGQDYLGKKLIKTIINELRDEGKLVLCILHDMDFAAETFERILILNKGKLLMDGPASNIFTDKDVLEKAHLEQPHVVQIAQQLGLKQTPLNENDLIDLMRKKHV